MESHPVQNRLRKAVEYSLLAGGKRLRGSLALLCCKLIAGDANNDAVISAAALEMVHTYSLIHDDLPAMDDDDFRRGRPSSHKAFDEATAILAGDGLLTMAFEIIAEKVSKPDIAVELIKQLSKAAGVCGMIAGQMADMLAEKIQPDEQTLEFIHTNKTAKMFAAAAAMGAISGGADEKTNNQLYDFGLKLGLAFQIADDILDVTADSQTLGKTAGKDAQKGKMTYPALMGLEKSRQLEQNLIADAINALSVFGEKAADIKQLTASLFKRKF